MTVLDGQMINSVWKTPHGDDISYDELIRQVRKHSNNGGQTYIGTDSFVERNCLRFIFFGSYFSVYVLLS